MLRRCIHSAIARAPAFVLDIDGVLIRGPNVLPAAKRALSILEGDNIFRTYVPQIIGARLSFNSTLSKLPYILLTNGGGVSEKHRSERLTQQLGFKIEPEQYIQAHTILKTLSHKYADAPVLVLGGKLDQVRQVAISYGFHKALTSLDVLAWNPSVWPFHQLTSAEAASTRAVNFSQTRVPAIFCFHDPRNWALDIQIICDLIQSEGRIGGPWVPLEEQTRPVELIFCNPDLQWKSDFPINRLGQGAFKAAFQGVFKALTGSEYPHVQFGKPSQPTYDFASKVLRERLEQLSGLAGPLPRIYMVGDNPESDIAGANAANWESILVRTGVFAGGKPSHTPTCELEDVEEAVLWAISREYNRK
ncbi:HAD-like domain-containing protein [Mycena amicta]|nr:HAD-like domain-containing protein [Mycena amicta]